MREIEFRMWLYNRYDSKAVQSNYISRIKRVEKELLGHDIDEEYEVDECENLMELFLKKNENLFQMKFPNSTFPVGKYYMSTYRAAIKKYVEFMMQDRQC